MQKKQKVIGVDGCKGGWLACSLSGNQAKVEIFNNWSQLMHKHQDSSRILVDIPLGLSDKYFKRTVDRTLRSALHERKSSVFTPPCRAAVYAHSYEKALEKNRAVTGKGISKQAYFLSPKIRELDDYLGKKIHQWPHCYESHPELNFQLLNGNKALENNKKINEGRSERWEIINHHHPKLAKAIQSEWTTYPKSFWQEDDLLDAACLAIVAGQKHLHFIEDTGQKDHRGIMIKIACYDS